MSNSSSLGTVSMSEVGMAKEARMTTRDRLPKERYCPNQNCFGHKSTRDYHARFCASCGTELAERIADLYLDLSPEQYPRTPEVQTSEVNKYPEPALTPEGKHSRISLRDLVKYLKEYEKEVFVEDL